MGRAKFYMQFQDSCPRVCTSSIYSIIGHVILVTCQFQPMRDFNNFQQLTNELSIVYSKRCVLPKETIRKKKETNRKKPKEANYSFLQLTGMFVENVLF